jgi:hypothetical protein
MEPLTEKLKNISVNEDEDTDRMSDRSSRGVTNVF